jgi:hypothetical protein
MGDEQIKLARTVLSNRHVIFYLFFYLSSSFSILFSKKSRYLHSKEEVLGLLTLEAVAGEVLAHPVDLGALLRRASVRVELPQTCLPRKPFADRSHRPPPPSLTLSFHIGRMPLARSRLQKCLVPKLADRLDLVWCS